LRSICAPDDVGFENSGEVSMRCILSATIIVVLAACGSEPSPEQESAQPSCEKYREHLLDVRVASLSTHREKHRAALARSLGDGFVADCERRLTQADLDCAMAATTTEQLHACSKNR
jgi:hypothetical protein